MKKWQVPILWAVLGALAFYAFSVNRQLDAAEKRIERATASLLNFHSSAPIEALFVQAREAPTEQNLSALTDALLEREKKYEALIHLYRPQVDPEVWAAFERPPTEQATVFFLNLSLGEAISEEDWATFDRIAEIWRQHEENVRLDIGHLRVEHPTSFAYQYIDLLRALDEAAPQR